MKAKPRRKVTREEILERMKETFWYFKQYHQKSGAFYNGGLLVYDLLKRALVGRGK